MEPLSHQDTETTRASDKREAGTTAFGPANCRHHSKAPVGMIYHHGTEHSTGATGTGVSEKHEVRFLNDFVFLRNTGPVERHHSGPRDHGTADRSEVRSRKSALRKAIWQILHHSREIKTRRAQKANAPVCGLPRHQKDILI